MPPARTTPRKTKSKRELLGSTAKAVAATLSAATAAITVFAFARTYGLVGAPAPTALTVGALGVTWVGLTPAHDTVTAIGDTIQLAATVTDVNGTALVGATISWSTDDPRVVETIGGGRVIARGPGTATVIATVGEKLARSRITVQQRATALQVERRDTLTISEDERRPLVAAVLDARGHPIAGRPAAWHSLDTTVVGVDSAGVATGRKPGTAAVSVTIDGLTEQLPLRVAAVPTALEVVRGGGQRGAAGTALAEPVIVRLLSRRGVPVRGIAVRFRTSDGGSLEPATATTDADGRAHASWTLGVLPGRQRALVSSERLDTVATLAAEADPVAENTRFALVGDSLGGQAGAEVGDTVRVRLTDSTGRALADVAVSWSASNGGRMAALGDRTDSLGEARARWTLGPRSGRQRAQLRAGGGRAAPVHEFLALATAGPPATLRVVSGGGQRGSVGTVLAKPVVVRLTDDVGNAVPAFPLAVATTGGEAADSVVSTDSLGLARIAWRMPAMVGAPRLRVRATGVAKAAEVTATARHGAAANVTFAPAPGRSPVRRALGKGVAVTVTDVHGNPVPRAVVEFRPGAGAVSPRKTVTDERGTARTRWTLGAKAGEQVLRAAVAGTDARATLTVQALPPAR